MNMIALNRNYMTILAAGTAVLALAVSGCGDKQAAETPPTSSTTVINTPPATTAAPAGSGTTVANGAPPTNNTNAGAGGATGAQADTADAVNKAIHANAQLTGSRITAVVDSAGVATLTGSAQNQQQKALAEKAARDAAGVTAVKNKIEINPTGGVKSPAPPKTVTKTITKIIVVPDKSKSDAASSDSTGTTATPTDSSAGTADSHSSTTTPATGSGQ